MPTLADLEYAYLGTLGATGSINDRRAQVYGANEWAYFAGLSGLSPASSYSLADHKLAYYGNVSGLTPKNLYSLSDHQAKFWSAPPPAGISAAFIGTAVDPANLTTYTFTAQPIGTASASRRVVVALTTSSARFVSSAIIGGIAATIDTQYTLVGTARIAFLSAVVPTGATADVVVTLDSAASYLGIAVWALTGGAPPFVDVSATGLSPSLPLTTVAGDVVLAVAHTSGVSVATFGWSTAVERWNLDVEVATETYSGTDTTASGTSTTINLTASGANTIAVAIVYR